MKTLGTTVDGNFIVEMSKEEHGTFRQLESAVEKSPFLFFHEHPELRGTPLSKTFLALTELVTAKDAVTKIQRFISSIDTELGG